MNNGIEEAETPQAGMARKTIYLGQSVLRRAEQKAKDDNRSFSNYIVQLIRRDLNEPAVAGAGGEEKAA